jgi:putative redox protein
MELKSTVVWRDGMAFDAELEGHKFTIDADEQFGGRGLGPRPKGLLATALAGCTAMDVIAILGKMRVEVDSFEVSADATLTDEHPKKYQSITVRYSFTGDDLPAKKLRRAIALSEERYCGVSATIAPTVELVHEIFVNGVPLVEEDSVAA